MIHDYGIQGLGEQKMSDYNRSRLYHLLPFISSGPFLSLRLKLVLKCFIIATLFSQKYLAIASLSLEKMPLCFCCFFFKSLAINLIILFHVH